jgi:hypothetical protein
MAAFAEESKLSGILLQDAYEAIRAWYLENLPMIEWRPSSYYTSSTAFIRALPPANEMSDLEIRAVCVEVLNGLLEWAYSENDGQFRMSEYACAALKPYGTSFSMTADEREELKTSALYPFFSFNRPAS